jgi:hypothetical protein
MRARAFVVVGLLAVACGGPPKAAPSPGSAREGNASAGRASAAPEPFVAASSPSDVVVRYVRPERSSRLDATLPRGTAHEKWSAPLEASLDPAFLLAAGTRIVVEGHKRRFAMFDTRGTPVASASTEGDVLVLAPANGTFVSVSPQGHVRRGYELADGHAFDPSESSVVPPESAKHGSAVVYAKTGQIAVADGDDLRPIIEGDFEALDVSVDDAGVAHAIVRQKTALSLWSTPVAGGSIGRVKLEAPRRDRSSTPPILGKNMRVIVLDDRMIALGPDGKKLWERRGAFTGGATMTADDRLLVADGPHVYAVDASGRVSEVTHVERVVFVTPPILTANGMLVVASGQRLHAFSF